MKQGLMERRRGELSGNKGETNAVGGRELGLRGWILSTP